MARRFGLWARIRKLSCLDPRRDQRRGYEPEVIAGPLIYALCSGGGCLSDSEALNDDPMVLKLFGVKKFADQTQVGEWLREQSEESVAALRDLLREFVAWIWEQAAPGRLWHAGLASYELGVNAYVVKPLHFNEFTAAVKQVGAFWAVVNEAPPGTTPQAQVKSS